ncbi:uncharacterized protein TNCV_3622481 [Trichonephila clavipes]|nr:uncharacterized protein TNCV_3622481 [Trichonephila clavipes]
MHVGQWYVFCRQQDTIQPNESRLLSNEVACEDIGVDSLYGAVIIQFRVYTDKILKLHGLRYATVIGDSFLLMLDSVRSHIARLGDNFPKTETILTGKKLCAFLCLPFLSKLAFRNQERKLLKATERVAQENINAALSEIKGSNSFTKWGISIDGTWQRRGYSSLNGCVSAISVDTGKILDIEVMTQYCHICAKGNCQSSKHVCSNYKGSAGNMEVVGAYRIFERSNVRNVQYNEYYGDGDSKGYESVKNFMELIQ